MKPPRARDLVKTPLLLLANIRKVNIPPESS